MDILETKIARKRKRLEEKDLLATGKKNFKCSEVVKKEKVDYVARIGYKVVRRDESNAPVLYLQLTDKLPMTLSRQEAIRGGEPVRLLGETDDKSYRGLRKTEIMSPGVHRSLRNELMDVEDKIDQQYLDELGGGQELKEEEQTMNDLKVDEEDTVIEELEVLGENFGKGDDTKDMNVIHKVLKFLLGVWAKELNARKDYVKRSVQGKRTSAAHVQTESFLKPLFQKLMEKTLPAVIRKSITDIIKFMLQREYVKVHDAYRQMVIGNGPRTMGITMVGIHACTGQEEVFYKPVPHVLKDVTQRKYNQGLRRLMTVCQKHFPTNPSECAEHNVL